MPAELVTMRDIATIAQVARPVVTIWRRRFRTGPRPFPSPRTHHGSQELFARTEVISWLEETDHGNNRDARTESAVDAVLSDPRLASARNLDALSALLTTRSLLGASLAGLDADDLLDAADGLDPDNTFLFAELDKADDLPWLADAAEQLLAASWSVAEAHQRLLASRLPVVTARAMLSAEAVRTVLALASPLLRDLGPEAALLDPTGCRFDVIPELASATDVPLTLLDGNTRSHRLLRRRLRLAQVIPAVIPAEDGWSAGGPTLSLVVLPEPAHPAASETIQLGLIDDVALQLSDGQALLVLAPSALLTDPLAGEAGSRRDQQLREGRVRAIVRLPAGMMPARAREALGLWLVTAADALAAADRRTLVADLSRQRLTPAAIDALSSDLLAARQGVDGARRRAWAHLHPVLTTSLLTTNGSLVPPRQAGPAAARTAATPTGADWVVRLSPDAATLLGGLELGVAPGRTELVSVAQAEQRGWLRVVTGRRFDPTPLVNVSPDASVRVWDAAAILDPNRRRVVDRLALHQRVDPILTEPGDVVFLSRPRPIAVLDPDGGAAVFSPARVLRVRPGGPFVPAALVMRINAQSGTDWRSWQFAVVREPEALSAAHAHLAARREELTAELARLDRFTADLTTAVESGQLSLTEKENHGQASS